MLILLRNDSDASQCQGRYFYQFRFVLWSGSEGKLLDFIKNGTNRFVTGLSRKFYFIEVNDTSDFEVSQLGGTI